MTTAAARTRAREHVWFAAGLVLLTYSVAGNWLVLPGYRRFLEGAASGSDTPPLAFALGAARTVLWMLSFHLGAFCIALAALCARGAEARDFRRGFSLGAVLWIGLWAVPSLPGPYTIFFAATGVAILLAICIVFARLTASAHRDGHFLSSFGDGRWQVASYFFFALATWDMCGLGSVGAILHPDSSVRAASHGLVVAQTTKLIVELALAWGLLALGALQRSRALAGVTPSPATS